jgi:ABC-type microcin C transport system permease subunit YejE
MKEKRIEIWFVLAAIFIPGGISLATFTKPENYWLIGIMVIFGFLSLIMAMVNIEIESFRDRKAKQIELTIKQIEREKEDTKW